MFATLLAAALTGQIISQTPPKKGDIVALIATNTGEPVKCWSSPQFMEVGRKPDVILPSGTLAIVTTTKFPAYHEYFCYEFAISNELSNELLVGRSSEHVVNFKFHYLPGL